MTDDRVGRGVRALRHRLHWTAELGLRAGCSASVISRVEHGDLTACRLETLERIVAVLGARLALFIDWRGGELQRLLDADHALLQERWAARKARADRWNSRQEVTYSVYGERGSIDDLAFDAETGTLLVSELKTGLYEIDRTLAKMDEKERHALSCAERFGWSVRRVVSCLVLAESRTNRRRVQQHAALFSRFDCRGRAADAWLRQPKASVGGLLLFVPLSGLRGTNARRAGRQRVRHSKADLRLAEREQWPSDADAPA